MNRRVNENQIYLLHCYVKLWYQAGGGAGVNLRLLAHCVGRWLLTTTKDTG